MEVGLLFISPLFQTHIIFSFSLRLLVFHKNVTPLFLKRIQAHPYTCPRSGGIRHRTKPNTGSRMSPASPSLQLNLAAPWTETWEHTFGPTFDSLSHLRLPMFPDSLGTSFPGTSSALPLEYHSRFSFRPLIILSVLCHLEKSVRLQVLLCNLFLTTGWDKFYL